MPNARVNAQAGPAPRGGGGGGGPEGRPRVGAAPGGRLRERGRPGAGPGGRFAGGRATSGRALPLRGGGAIRTDFTRSG